MFGYCRGLRNKDKEHSKKRMNKTQLIKRSNKSLQLHESFNVVYKFYDTREVSGKVTNFFSNQLSIFGIKKESIKIENKSIQCNILLHIINQICSETLSDSYEVISKFIDNDGNIKEILNLVHPPDTIINFRTPNNKIYSIKSLYNMNTGFDGFLITTENKNLIEFNNLIENIKLSNLIKEN